MVLRGPGRDARTPFRSCLVFTLLGALAAFVLGVILVNLVLLPWHVRLGREANVPDVLGLDRDAAEKQLKAAGFSAGDARYVGDSLYAAGKVVDTRPKPGTRVKVGRVIGLDISAGQEKTQVPQVAKLPVRRAQAAVENAGLRVGTIESVSSATIPEGQVIATDPAPGSKVNKGTAVNLTVSMGSIGVFEMPHLRGMPFARAKDVIFNAGLVLAETSAVASPEPSGTVLSQDPAERAEVQTGDRVKLTIARPAPKAQPAKTAKPGTGKTGTKSGKSEPAKPKPVGKPK